MPEILFPDLIVIPQKYLWTLFIINFNSADKLKIISGNSFAFKRTV